MDNDRFQGRRAAYFGEAEDKRDYSCGGYCFGYKGSARIESDAFIWQSSESDKPNADQEDGKSKYSDILVRQRQTERSEKTSEDSLPDFWSCVRYFFGF